MFQPANLLSHSQVISHNGGPCHLVLLLPECAGEYLLLSSYLTLFSFVSGHDGEGQLRRHRQPQADPQGLPRQDQVPEGPPR